MGESYQYDVVIVGAGPAGLSAARTTARLGFSTVVLERAAEAGVPAQPCSAILAPMPGILKGRRLLGDLFYPQLDLLIPLSLVVGYPRLNRFVSPGGYELEAGFASGDGSPVAAIDKGGLLRLMAEQAASAGAEFRFGVEVSGLIGEEGQVVGVKTNQGEVRGSLVLAAEGTSRRLSRAAGLFPRTSEAARHALILHRELLAPNVRRQHLGQITTFGKRYTSAREGFGSVVMPISGRASVYYTLLADSPHHHTEQSAGYYLDEYIENDPRVRELLAGSETAIESYCTVAVHDGPSRIARDGFLSLGDAATPAGHVGILGAMWLGRQAALVAAEALDVDDLSASRLSLYGHLFHNRLLRTLKAEQRLMLDLAQMPDAELDHLVQALAALPLAAPFFSGWQGIPWEAARWLAKNYPSSTYRTGLLQRVLDHDIEEHGHRVELPAAGAWPLPLSSHTALHR